MISQITEITDTTEMRRAKPALTISALAFLIAVGCLAACCIYIEVRWLVMWLIASALFFTCKGLTILATKDRPETSDFIAYLLLWPGLNPSRFVSATRDPETGIARGGIVNLLFGSALLWMVTRRMADQPMIAAWIGMVGLVFVLHFGLFRLIAAFWMRRGRGVEPLMRCPIAAASLTDFWSRRWNLAFRDVSHALVFRPVSARWGPSAATWAVFGLSGVLHELVTSVPAGAGFGGQTAYFLLQALGIHLARNLNIRTGIAARLWALGFILLPLGLLFHPPFVHRVMIPFFQFIGALP